jgi:uncharacterized phage-associated protein
MGVIQPEDSVAFALYLYKKAIDRSLYVNISKLQSLVYVCYGMHYAKHRCSLLAERPVAGQKGVIFNHLTREVYDGRDGLSQLATSYQLHGKLAGFKSYDSLICLALDKFGTKSSSWLSSWIMNNGQAWQNARFKATYVNEAVMDSHDVVSDFREQKELRLPHNHRLRLPSWIVPAIGLAPQQSESDKPNMFPPLF